MPILTEREQATHELLAQLATIDTDPDFAYYLQGMPEPTMAVVVGEYAYAFGPDDNLWMADVLPCGLTTDGRVHADWNDAGPVYTHLEYMYGELFKLRAIDDDDIYVMLGAHVHIVRALAARVLEA